MTDAFAAFEREPYVQRAMTTYGTGDASYRAAGGSAGLIRLADAFYAYMRALPEAAGILAMHQEPLTVSRDKLATFLCGWLGGPKMYAREYGPMAIPAAHAHLTIDGPERDAWLLCMKRAVDEQPWEPSFKEYFMRAITVPAERVRVVSVARREQEHGQDR